MKLTKSRLKQLIKETLKEAIDPDKPKGEQWWIDEMRNLMTDMYRNRHEAPPEYYQSLEKKAVDLYNNMPAVGKTHLIQNLEMYAERFGGQFARYLSALQRPLGEKKEPSEKSMKKTKKNTKRGKSNETK
jgi:hypothetical protein